MAGPTSKVGTPVANGSDVVHGRDGRALAGPTEAVGIVDNDDNIVVGAVPHCHDVGTTARQPPSTNPTREPIPARNRTEETQAFGPPQRRRKTRATKKCCNCVCNATCQSRGAWGHHKCSCLLEGRKCTYCLFSAVQKQAQHASSCCRRSGRRLNSPSLLPAASRKCQSNR
jgi:hypothetical protein